MKLTSLKLSAKEAKGEYGGPQSVGKAIDENLPRYPYGTRIDLETEALEKLGLSPSDFTVGQKLNVVCEVEVVRLSESQSLKGKDRCSMDLQITDMAIDTKAVKKKKAEDKHLNEISGPAPAEAEY